MKFLMEPILQINIELFNISFLGGFIRNFHMSGVLEYFRAIRFTNFWEQVEAPQEKPIPLIY